MRRDNPADPLDAAVRVDPAAALGDFSFFNETVARNWWMVALRGLFAVLFGLFAFLWPGITMLSLIIVFAAYRLVDGVSEIVAAVRAARRRQRWGVLALSGVLDLGIAAIAFLWPGITVIAFVLLMAAWSLVTGGFMLAGAWRLRRDHGRIWLALGGVLSIVFAILLAMAPPAGALVLTWWIGAYALASGILLLIVAFKLRARRRDLPPAALQGAA